ncbi:MAG: heparinase II/III family protein [Bacteroidales bacterium]|nr:heparinase II/III family protein [Bacteroidales bacterium]
MSSIRRGLLLFFILLGTAAFARAQAPGPHPRLLVSDEERGQDEGYHFQNEYSLKDLQRGVAGNPVARQADSVIVAFCDAVLDKPPVTRTFIGRRLLGTSREALKRIFWLSYTYRVHGGEAYARKAIDEMLAVSAFSDWNPAHFLDVGEMTMALAIGYDWLYDIMTPAERETVARAILDKGLKPAMNEKDAWFYNVEINWNSVCNAGMVYGALAVWEKDPGFCRLMLEKSLESNKLAYNAYTGGGYPEGYNYWGYGTSFQVMLEAGVESAFRQTTGNITPDFLASSEFIRFTSTPAGNCYSFSDSYRKATGQYMQAWMLSRTGDPTLLYPEIGIMESTGYKRLCEERLFPMFIISLAKSGRHAETGVPEKHHYRCEGTTPIFVYRSGWTSRNDTYLGIKGGLTMSSHSHCDQGSFYFESDGVTWATDLGMQDYNSLETAGVDLWDMTQDSERWSVFRIGPFSHNILTVNGHTPKVNHPASFSHTWMPESAGRIGAELDLTDLYTEDLDSCKRAVYLQDGNLSIVDCLQAGDSACTVRWAMCTEAEATLLPDGRILLQADGKRRILSASLTGPATTRKEPAPIPHIWPTTFDPATPDLDGMEFLHPTDTSNPGTTLVGYTFTQQPHQKAVLHVTLSRGT